MVKLDSPGPAVRTIERWKRGVSAALVLAVLVLAALLPAALIGWTASQLGASGELVGVIAAVLIAPWMIGDRRSLQILGGLARASDS